MKRIAVIPARGGSKRLPKKNIIDFFGKPMIAWTIEAAKHTELFDMILVSTDSEEIADIAIKYGASVPFLRNANADDHSTVSEATLTALNQLKENDIYCETVVQLMANCPLRTAKNILDQVAFFELQSKKRSILSSVKYGMFNPWWAHFKDENGNYKRLFDSYDKNTRSQDLPELLCPSGATWISNVSDLEDYKTFYSPEYSFFELDWKEAVDVDDSEDLKLAKVAYKWIDEEI